jgi:serine acetyltransferase
VNPGANISGDVLLGESVTIGSGAQVLQYLHVGSGAIVGPGAVVTSNVPNGITVVGVPSRHRAIVEETTRHREKCYQNRRPL